MNIPFEIKQIYVEIERARLTRTLAKIKEDAGKIAEAANILQELQVIIIFFMSLLSIPVCFVSLFNVTVDNFSVMYQHDFEMWCTIGHQFREQIKVYYVPKVSQMHWANCVIVLFETLVDDKSSDSCSGIWT